MTYPRCDEAGKVSLFKTGCVITSAESTWYFPHFLVAITGFVCLLYYFVYATLIFASLKKDDDVEEEVKSVLYQAQAEMETAVLTVMEMQEIVDEVAL